MFERVYPANPPRRPMLSAPVGASIAFHVAAFVVAGYNLPVYVSEQVMEGILYFAPPPTLPARPATEQLTYLDIPLGGLGEGLIGSAEILSDGAETPVGRDGLAKDPGTGDAPAPALGDLPQVKLDSVYFPDEVDNPAAYDPRSAAPAYPDSLQGAGVEGSVTVQFVVDTLGRAVHSTLHVVNATHPRFAQSVQEALPRMLFRPAELTGVKINQLVQQTFTFRLPTRPGTREDSAMRVRPPL